MKSFIYSEEGNDIWHFKAILHTPPTSKTTLQHITLINKHEK